MWAWLRKLFFKPTPIIVEPQTGPLKGLDLSSYQPDVNWQKLKDAGVKFVLIKASEFLKDPLFDTHWMNAKNFGIVRGAYHFFHPELDPETQARLFVTSVGKLQADDLPCVMDWEHASVATLESQKQHALAFLREVHALTGKPPIIYGSPYFLSQLNLGPEFANYPLWVAHYGVKQPAVPPPWTFWSFWQTDAHARLDGIHGASDTDLFNGSLAQLMALARGSAPTI